jgi:hypothetical protein
VDGPDLRRNFGDAVSSLPTADEDTTALALPHYDVYPYDTGADITQSFRNYMAGWNDPSSEPQRHNRVHNWVGGSMLTDSSPNDPVFWLVHANLDRIWAKWQASNTDDYPSSGAPSGENLDDQMDFFSVTPKDVLNHSSLGYTYDTESASGGSSGPAASLRSLAFVQPVSNNTPKPVSSIPVSLAGHHLHASGHGAGQNTQNQPGGEANSGVALGSVHLLTGPAAASGQFGNLLHWHGPDLSGGVGLNLSPLQGGVAISEHGGHGSTGDQAPAMATHHTWSAVVGDASSSVHASMAGTFPMAGAGHMNPG